MRAVAREESPAARAPRAVQAPVSAPQPVALRPPRTLARCSGGTCKCGGRCGGGHVDEDELQRLTVARAAIDAGGSRALARAVAERHAHA